MKEISSVRKSSTWKAILQHKYLYLLMIPGLLWLLVFHIAPLFGIVIAFMDYNPMVDLWESEWVGFQHFKDLLSTQSFLRILGNTLKISAAKIFLGFPVPLILALLIHGCKRKKFKKLIQTCSYLPNFLSWIVIVGISFVLFNPYYGVFQNVFEALGIPYTDVTTDKDSFLGFIVGSAIWKGMGMQSIIYLAALTGMDTDMFEAAELDGANRFQQLWHITLPTIAPVCAVVLILSVGGLLSGDFEQIYLFAGENAQLRNISDIFETFVYRNGVRAAEFSFPAAVGLFQSCFSCLLVLLTNWLAKKMGYDGLW